MTPEERYQQDPLFHRLVYILAEAAETMRLSTSDLRAAADLAERLVEHRRRSFLRVRPDAGLGTPSMDLSTGRTLIHCGQCGARNVVPGHRCEGFPAITNEMLEQDRRDAMRHRDMLARFITAKRGESPLEEVRRHLGHLDANDIRLQAGGGAPTLTLRLGLDDGRVLALTLDEAACAVVAEAMLWRMFNTNGEG